MTTQLPEGFNPLASVRAAMGRTGERDALLKRHNVSVDSVARPTNPFQPNGQVTRPGSTPAYSGPAPSNGGIAPAMDPRLAAILNS